MRIRERIALALLFAMGVWVIGITVRIEVQNAAAGYYLPRGNNGDGKWRISANNTPRDQLRGTIQRFGILQYVFAPILIALSIASFFVYQCRRARLVAAFASACGCIGMAFALYRGYLPSLGW